MKVIAVLMLVAVAGCAQTGDRASQSDDPAMDAAVLGAIMGRPNPFATQPAPVMGSPVFISGPRGGSVICQRTSPNSAFCS